MNELKRLSVRIFSFFVSLQTENTVFTEAVGRLGPQGGQVQGRLCRVVPHAEHVDESTGHGERNATDRQGGQQLGVLITSHMCGVPDKKRKINFK